jgi:SpoVK/Ycf46/Vps4 family AAA+-type ATPase
MERMMTELVGMEEVKKQVINIVKVMKYNKIRSKMNLDGGTYHNVHVMLGAPGTAKTTVAQFMGQIMVEEHLLPDDRYICVNGAELKGMYVGHSAPKTKALFEENDIIVIDEAYSLVGDHGQNDSFSKEALAQLIIELENHSTDKLVIFAGYGGGKVNEKNNKMKDFLDANPGIKSRITSTIYFDSYNAQEMVEIFMRIAKNQKYKVDDSVRTILAGHFAKRVGDENFGNGREARSLLETSVVFAANRILVKDKNKYTKEEMQTITYDDVAAAIAQVEQAELTQNAMLARRMGF